MPSISQQKQRPAFQKRRRPPPRRDRPGSKRPRTIFHLDDVKAVAPPERPIEPLQAIVVATGDPGNGDTIGTETKEISTIPSRDAATPSPKKSMTIESNNASNVESKSLNPNIKINISSLKSETDKMVREARGIEAEIESMLQHNQQDRNGEQQPVQECAKTSDLHDYILEPRSSLAIDRACGFTEDQVHILIAKRWECKNNQDYADADKIQKALRQNKIHTNDHLNPKRFRLDGSNYFKSWNEKELRHWTTGNPALVEGEDSDNDDNDDSEDDHDDDDDSKNSKTPWWTKSENQHKLENWVMGKLDTMITAAERKEERSLMDYFDEKILMHQLLYNIEQTEDKDETKSEMLEPNGNTVVARWNIPKLVPNRARNGSNDPFVLLFTPSEYDKCIIKPLLYKFPDSVLHINLREDCLRDNHSYLLEVRVSNARDTSEAKRSKEELGELRSRTEAYLRSKISRINLRRLLEDGASLELDLVLSIKEPLGVSFSKFMVEQVDTTEDSCPPGLWIKRVLPGKGIAKAIGSDSIFCHGCALLALDGEPIQDPLVMQTLMKRAKNDPQTQFVSIKICLSKHSDMRTLPLQKLLKSFGLRRRDGKPLDPDIHPALSGPVAIVANETSTRMLGGSDSTTSKPKDSTLPHICPSRKSNNGIKNKNSSGKESLPTKPLGNNHQLALNPRGKKVHTATLSKRANSEKSRDEINVLRKLEGNDHPTHSSRENTNPAQNDNIVSNSEKVNTEIIALPTPMNNNDNETDLRFRHSGTTTSPSNSEKVANERELSPKLTSDDNKNQANNSSMILDGSSTREDCAKAEGVLSDLSEDDLDNDPFRPASNKVDLLTSTDNLVVQGEAQNPKDSTHGEGQSGRKMTDIESALHKNADSIKEPTSSLPRDAVETRQTRYDNSMSQRQRGNSAPVLQRRKWYVDQLPPRQMGHKMHSHQTTMTITFEVALNTSKPLGGYFRTERGQNFKSKCVLFSKHRGGQFANDARMKIGTQVTVIMVGERRINVEDHHTLRTRYIEAKQHRNKLRLILQNNHSCKPEPVSISRLNWSSSGAWIGEVTNGWAGGTVSKKDKASHSNPRDQSTGLQIVGASDKPPPSSPPVFSPKKVTFGTNTVTITEERWSNQGSPSWEGLSSPRGGSPSPLTIIEGKVRESDAPTLPGEESFVDAIRNKSWKELIHVLETGADFGKEFVQKLLHSQYHYVDSEIKKLTSKSSDGKIIEDLDAKKKILKLYINSAHLIEKAVSLRSWSEVMFEMKFLQLFNLPPSAVPGRKKIVRTKVRSKSLDIDLGGLLIDTTRSRTPYKSKNAFSTHNNCISSLENRKLVVEILEGDPKSDQSQPQKFVDFIVTLDEIDKQCPSEGRWHDFEKRSGNIGIIGYRAKRCCASKEYFVTKRQEVVDLLKSQIVTVERFNGEYCQTQPFKLTSNVRGINGVSLLYAAVEIMADVPLVQKMLSLGSDPRQQPEPSSHSRCSPLELARKQFDRCKEKEMSASRHVRHAFAEKSAQAKQLLDLLEAVELKK